MKKFVFCIFFIVVTFICSGQGISNLWLMGGYAWAGPPFGGTDMDFTGGTLSLNYNTRKMNLGTTTGEICDRNGNFLFSSNGIWVSNASNDTMIGGGRGFNPSA